MGVTSVCLFAPIFSAHRSRVFRFFRQLSVMEKSDNRWKHENDVLVLLWQPLTAHPLPRDLIVYIFRGPPFRMLSFCFQDSYSEIEPHRAQWCMRTKTKMAAYIENLGQVVNRTMQLFRYIYNSETTKIHLCYKTPLI